MLTGSGGCLFEKFIKRNFLQWYEGSYYSAYLWRNEIKDIAKIMGGSVSNTKSRFLIRV